MLNLPLHDTYYKTTCVFDLNHCAKHAKDVCVVVRGQVRISSSALLKQQRKDMKNKLNFKNKEARWE